MMYMSRAFHHHYFVFFLYTIMLAAALRYEALRLSHTADVAPSAGEA
jgi:hypothetical protein